MLAIDVLELEAPVLLDCNASVLLSAKLEPDAALLLELEAPVLVFKAPVLLAAKLELEALVFKAPLV